ncbi:hypothetical protein FBD94_05190 [Pedobacter hiemivivus]|uniref:Lipoprotein n=1 Tax=Pedobacter hiemivivus TaxID=2530454 RepID=A0A4U1GIP5_9SPHI|nr:hypothetical protein [Pedobacter hiemivivus]TKC63744.1 hypothetical protein FBD94_05190 [Pedobacter hiemivivus]
MKKPLLPFLGIIFILSSCYNSEIDRDETATMYQAINKGDTAILKIKLTDKEFYGQYEVNYHGAYKDSGGVTGIIKGDTLKGTYRFQHYGIEKWHTAPIALLKKDDQLIMGEGSLEIYMNIPYFKKHIPINYKNPKFVFEKMR